MCLFVCVSHPPNSSSHAQKTLHTEYILINFCGETKHKMESSSSEDDFVVLSLLKKRIKKRKYWVHPILGWLREEGGGSTLIVKTPLKMFATDAKNAAKIRFVYNGRKFQRQCVNMIDTSCVYIFSTCVNFRREFWTLPWV